MWKSFPLVKSSCNRKMTAHPHLMPRLKMSAAIPYSPMCPHSMYMDNFTVINYINCMTAQPETININNKNSTQTILES